jgi:hypothetical protein
MSSPETSPSQPWTEAPSLEKPIAPPPKPAAAPLKPASPNIGQRIEYFTALRFPRSRPDWVKNTLISCLFLLIPVLNQLIVFGYAYEITEYLHRGLGPGYPQFDLKRFGAYVQRGVWPFIIAFIVQTILQPVMQVLLQGTMFGTMAAFDASEETGTIVAAIVIPLVIVLLIALITLLTLFLTPLLMRAGLSQDFVQAFKFRWIVDFVKRMWVETILVNIFVIMTNIIALSLGCLAFCIGFFFMGMYMAIAGAHLNYQLYELYLARGGEPIPLKPLPADVPPVVSG